MNRAVGSTVSAPATYEVSADNASNSASVRLGRLSKLTAAGIAEAQALFDVLANEHQALITCDPISLAALLPDKRARIANLYELDVRVKDALMQAGAPADPAKVARWLAANDIGGELAGSWQAFVGLLRRCRHQNRLNGSALSLQRQNVERALRLLRGGAAAALYNRGGLEPGFDASRTLGRV